MNGLAQHDVVLTFSTADNSANATSDYLAQSTVSYTIDSRAANNVHIPVGIVGNLMAEPTEDFKGTITMSNANGQQVTVAGATATSTINDNDVYTVSLLLGSPSTKPTGVQTQNFVATMTGTAQKDVVL